MRRHCTTACYQYQIDIAARKNEKNELLAFYRQKKAKKKPARSGRFFLS